MDDAEDDDDDDDDADDDDDDADDDGEDDDVTGGARGPGSERMELGRGDVEEEMHFLLSN